MDSTTEKSLYRFVDLFNSFMLCTAHRSLPFDLRPPLTTFSSPYSMSYSLQKLALVEAAIADGVDVLDVHRLMIGRTQAEENIEPFCETLLGALRDDFARYSEAENEPRVVLIELRAMLRGSFYSPVGARWASGESFCYQVWWELKFVVRDRTVF